MNFSINAIVLLVYTEVQCIPQLSKLNCCIKHSKYYMGVFEN